MLNAERAERIGEASRGRDAKAVVFRGLGQRELTAMGAPLPVALRIVSLGIGMELKEYQSRALESFDRWREALEKARLESERPWKHGRKPRARYPAKCVTF